MKRSTKGSSNTRLIREVIELAKELESGITSAKSLKYVLTESVVKSRDRLKEVCEDILYSSPIEFGRKAEDFLWKRCFHDLMQFYKRNKKRMTSSEISLLQIHLTTGFGLYYSLLLGVSKHYSINIQNLMPYITVEQSIEEFCRESQPNNEEVDAWARNAIHRILICMGDLARYLFDLEVIGYRELAIRFYDLALIWNPDIGMPFNQLGTLSESNNYGLDSVYYYMRCLTCDKPFEGAENNLRRVFETNEKRLNEIEDKQSSEESYRMIERSILLFLKLCNEYWFIKSSDNQFNKHILPLLQQTLQSLNTSFNLQPKLTTEQMPTFMTPMTTFEMSVITLILVNRIQELEDRKNSANGSQMFPLILNFSINYLMAVVASSHQSVKNKLGLDPFKLNGLSSMSPGVSKENTPDLSPRRALSRLRRRKAAINYDDKNVLSLDDDDSELSELEETALSTIDALEIGSDLSDSNEGSDSYNLDVTIISSDEETPLPHRTVGPKHSDTPVMPVEDVLNYVLNDSYLPTIKMYCDWFRSNPNILSLISNQLQLWFEEFINFVNSLLNIEHKILQSFPNLSEFKCYGVNWHQKFPLASDLSLSNIECLKSSFNAISFESQRVLNNCEKGFLCIESIIAFTHFVSDSDYCPNVYGISYDSIENRFSYNSHSNGTNFNYFPTNTWSEDNSIFVSSNPQSINDIEDNESVDDSKRQKKFMRNMAHLWLTAEVNQLEKDVSFAPQLPPYMVLDSSAYCQHLDFIKELTHSKRFIIVVPKIVLASLDQMKKTNATAREAIRWLEEQLQRGNRVIKFAKDAEKLNLSPIKYPKRKDREAFDYYELLEYCNYLNTNTKTDRKLIYGMPMVSLLTHSFDRWPANAEAVAKTSGIHIESVNSFVTKWQNSVKAIT
ncbi:unnamed protein product [Oppiella nova]|uniref:PIN domain-containing protein n=1 Tax=Oppiella nova TaxID=334625 RepID=A0A7R9L8Y3_9ACAR|nr:unnamed protein product [Oppiella nova]CAG2160109.1 unnamed protein product [Oppiella nova]